jgi:hypothetical protein
MSPIVEGIEPIRKEVMRAKKDIAALDEQTKELREDVQYLGRT